MKNKSTIFKISFTGIMLSLVILFQFLEQFMPFGEFGFVKFNFSIIFIFATAFIAGMPWAYFLLILRFAIGPALGQGGYNEFAIIGHIILMVSGVLLLSLFWITTKITKFNKLWKYIVVSISITLIVSLIMSLLNALVFTRWYFAAFSGSWTILPFNEAYEQYDNVKFAYFFIPNYWWGNIAVYGVFNIINISACFIINYPLSKIVKRFSISTQTQ